MPVYTVHAPTARTPISAPTDRFVFVRDGFHFWAFLFGPLWLVWHRLWLALIGWIVAVAVLDLGMAQPRCRPMRRSSVQTCWSRC